MNSMFTIYPVSVKTEQRLITSPMDPALQVGSYPLSHQGSPRKLHTCSQNHQSDTISGMHFFQYHHRQQMQVWTELGVLLVQPLWCYCEWKRKKWGLLHGSVAGSTPCAPGPQMPPSWILATGRSIFKHQMCLNPWVCNHI